MLTAMYRDLHCLASPVCKTPLTASPYEGARFVTLSQHPHTSPARPLCCRSCPLVLRASLHARDSSTRHNPSSGYTQRAPNGRG